MTRDTQDTMERKAFKLPEHFMISSTDGALYDTRVAGWHKLPPLRAEYQGTFRGEMTPRRLKAALRQRWAWPGGYELVYLTSDGALLCHDCVVKHLRNVLDDLKQTRGSGWKVKAVSYEAVSAEICDADLCSHCDQCGRVFGELGA